MILMVCVLMGLLVPTGHAGEPVPAVATPKPHVFELKTKGKNSQSLKLAYVQGMAVNEACFNELKKCERRLRQSLVGNKALNSTADLISPASEACGLRGGLSVTLVDTESNEYAYCELSGRYLIDAWALFDWARTGEPSLQGPTK